MTQVNSVDEAKKKDPKGEPKGAPGGFYPGAKTAIKNKPKGGGKKK